MTKIIMPSTRFKTTRDAFLNELNKAVEKKFGTLDKIHADYFNKELELIKNVPDEWLTTMLIVSDMTRYMRRYYPNSISSGRGTIVGSFAAYLLEITGIDPVIYELMPERFYGNSVTNPIPLIDVDVASDCKKIAIQYLQEQYGDRCVFGGLNERLSKHYCAVFISESPYEGIMDLETGFFCNEMVSELMKKGHMRINLISSNQQQYIMNQCSLMDKNPEANYSIKSDLFNPILFTGLYESLFSSDCKKAIHARYLSKCGNKLRTFDDVVVAISKYNYQNRMELFEYADLYNIQEIDAILADTRGHIVYQEQILRLLQYILNIDFHTANELRKSIREEKKTVINTVFTNVVTTLITNGMNEEQVVRFWNNLRKAVANAPVKAHFVATAFDTTKASWLATQEKAFN